ncbi:MAG TPA: hypothetical protein VFQ79_25105 [Bryobacteraceae bacterium]|nr:hypothetical protein [Bryobacteraceae bacterium]
MGAKLQREGERVEAVVGSFDPLVAEQARYLHQLAASGARLFAVISHPERPLLSASARAELVAALKDIDFVVLGEGDRPEEFLKCLPDGCIHRREHSDAQLTEQFIRHVQGRQRTS